MTFGGMIRYLLGEGYEKQVLHIRLLQRKIQAQRNDLREMKNAYNKLRTSYEGYMGLPPKLKAEWEAQDRAIWGDKVVDESGRYK